ncbi:AAA family ATPase [Tsukamurella sp. 8F]|uniref:AAA family ATPase n=1 Tax=unclassified Tsukamurella TaxID=2633480 RepID=UPI0023B9F0AB|nr:MULTISPECIES: AAA family ATPase [unclassified Tsukamurella]MDF0531509.1 AAA family ATPase [Tsukamurella sp. 8J]MDF0588753.1 AAA family ATPase [Tsukamurella sp. 8F]
MTDKRKPRLVVVGGLPGVGKTTLCRMLAAHLGAAYLRIDTVEQAIRENAPAADRAIAEGLGYTVAQRIAADTLVAGTPVVADCVNPIEQSRRAWRAVAEAVSATIVDVEIVCSDTGEHRARVESRIGDIPGLEQPTWADVREREYQPSTGAVRVDTAGRTPSESLRELLAALAA